MFRSVFTITTLLLLMVCQLGKADFLVITDPANFNSNDIAQWQRGPTSSAGPYPTNQGYTTFSFAFSTTSVPYFESLVRTTAGGLFVGVTSSGTGQNAGYQVDAAFQQPGPLVVYSVGFHIIYLSPSSVLRVWDTLGRSQGFTLDLNETYLRPNPALPPSTFFGVNSRDGIARLSFSSTVTDETSVFGISALSLNVAIPAPPAVVLLGIASVITIGWHRRWYPQTPAVQH